MHGHDTFDYNLTCVYCGFKITRAEYQKRFGVKNISELLP